MKIGVVSLGCPKNRVDTENMLGILKNKKFIIENNSDECDVIIVNTCGFIEEAKEESINTILEMSKYKEKKCKALIVTGCLAQRYRDEIINEIPEVDAVLGTTEYKKIEEVILKAVQGTKTINCNLDNSLFTCEDDRVITNDGVYAYIKIAEGCNNNCTYCIIPKLRGEYRSRYIEDIFEEAKKLVSFGKTEIILIAQDVTRYGKDIYNKVMLPELINKLSKIECLRRIRLLYTYPDDINTELIKEIKRNKKVCNYLDIPIQHGSNKILKSMGRRGNKEELKILFKKIRDEIPDIVLRTSVIVGFPGESKQDYQELQDLIEEIRFDRLGVFKYSREEGTKAFDFKEQVDDEIKDFRYNGLMELQQIISKEKNSSSIGKVFDVAVEGIAEDGIFYFGRSSYETPDIDGVIYFTSSEPLKIDDYVNVKILTCDEYDLIGEVTNEFTK